MFGNRIPVWIGRNGEFVRFAGTLAASRDRAPIHRCFNSIERMLTALRKRNRREDL